VLSIQGFHFRVESADCGGVTSLAHFERRGPFVKLGEQGGLDLFDSLGNIAPLLFEPFRNPLFVFVGQHTTVIGRRVN
jgi:fermentation-respiration switch protein FrsA (DUF1100 family)